MSHRRPLATRRAAARRTPALAVTLILAGTLWGCGDATGPGGEPITQLPRALSPAETEVIAASNDFGLALLGEVVAVEDGPNVVLSPLSASMALGMTLNGAAGETFQAMRATLGYGALTRGEVNAAYRDLLDLLTGLDGEVDFSVANSVWAHEGFPFHDAFFESVTAAFDARVESRDFQDPATLEAINGWVDAETEGRIPRLLDAIDPELVMFLVNAIWFDGTWTTRFDPDETAPADFHRADGSTVTVDLMRLLEPSLPVVVGDGFTAVDLPYGGGAFGMTVVLPEEGRDAREFAAGLDDPTWRGITDALQERELGEVALPRFTLSYGTRLDPMLEAMGMGIAFDEVAADFSDLSPLGQDLFISEVRQKTFIEVDEAGTRAAAATSVGIGVTSAPPSLVVDRPFVFAIRERLTGTLIFAGVVGDPTAEG